MVESGVDLKVHCGSASLLMNPTVSLDFGLISDDFLGRVDPSTKVDSVVLFLSSSVHCQMRFDAEWFCFLLQNHLKTMLRLGEHYGQNLCSLKYFVSV